MRLLKRDMEVRKVLENWKNACALLLKKNKWHKIEWANYMGMSLLGI